MKYKVAVFTSTRAEYGLLRNLCKLLDSEKLFQLVIIVTGTHLEDEYGYTSDQIKKDGFSNLKLIKLSIKDDNNTAEITAQLIIKISKFFENFNPDFLIVLGDRYEALGAVYSAFLKKIKILHLHGGEETFGSLDNGFRNAISQLANLHFTSLEKHTKNLLNMGINKKNIFTVGPMVTDLLNCHKSITYSQFEKELNFKFGKFNIILTFHPESYINDYGLEKLKNIFKAIIELEANVLITYPNIDEGGSIIKAALIDFSEKNSDRCFLYKSLGSDLYISSLKLFDVVIGNSSSGIIEAPLIGIPSLNIGERQKGRSTFGKVYNLDGSYSLKDENTNIKFDKINHLEIHSIAN